EHVTTDLDDPESEQSDEQNSDEIGNDQDESDEFDLGDHDSDEDEEKKEDNHDVERESVESDDDNVIEAYTQNWDPVETSQEEPHEVVFDKSSEDWTEMEQAIKLATD